MTGLPTSLGSGGGSPLTAASLARTLNTVEGRSATQKANSKLAIDPIAKLQRIIANRQGVLRLPSAIAAAPTIVASAGNGAPAFGDSSNRLFYDLLSGNGITHTIAGTWTLTYSPGGNNFYVPPNLGGDGGSVGWVGTIHDGSNLFIKSDGSTSYTVFADGQLVTPTTTPINGVAGVPSYDSFLFPSRARRKIDIFGRLGYGVSGIGCGNNETLSALGLPNTTIAWMTDSYGYQPSSLGGWGFAMGAHMRLTNSLPGAALFWLSAGGGSGYVTPGIPNKTFIQRLPDVLAQSPDMLVTSGGINDGTGTLQDAVTAYCALVRAGAPNVVHVVGGCWSPNGTNIASGLSKEALILAGLQAGDPQGPWVFISNLTGSWQNSSGASGKVGFGPWQTGDGRQITADAPLVAASAMNLVANWGGTTSTYKLAFSDGSVFSATLTNGSKNVSWSAGVTATANAVLQALPTAFPGGTSLNFTGALTNATSATLAAAWTGTTGQYYVRFSDSSIRIVTLTNGATTATWAGLVTADAAVGAYTTTRGNAISYVGPDGTHPVSAGSDYLGANMAEGIAAGVAAL